MKLDTGVDAKWAFRDSTCELLIQKNRKNSSRAQISNRTLKKPTKKNKKNKPKPEQQQQKNPPNYLSTR